MDGVTFRYLCPLRVLTYANQFLRRRPVSRVLSALQSSVGPGLGKEREGSEGNTEKKSFAAVRRLDTSQRGKKKKKEVTLPTPPLRKRSDVLALPTPCSVRSAATSLSFRYEAVRAFRYLTASLSFFLTYLLPTSYILLSISVYRLT